MIESPNLLVGWEGRWDGFVSSVPVVFSRSPGGESSPVVARGIPLRRPFFSLLGHCALVFGWLWLSPWLFLLFPPGIQVTPVRMVISGMVYYLPPALPETSDESGARSGIEGQPGGKHAYHPLQSIRIARGPKPVDRIVDAPRLKLPRTAGRVANLLAFTGAAPAPPVDAVSRPLHQAGDLSSAPAPIAPAPEATLKASLRTLPPLAASQFQPGPPPPMEIRNSLNTPRTADVEIAAPAPSAVVQVPKLTLPAAGAVPPLAPPLRRAISDAPALSAAGVSASAAPLSPEGAAGPAGSSSGGAGEQALESRAASSSSRHGAGGNGGAAIGDGVGAGGGDAQGLIVSLNPGDQLGIPPGDVTGSLAMSPDGTAADGLGGSGGGGSIGHGRGTGSGTTGAGPGSGLTGNGPGAANAAVGISLAPGAGGAGQARGTLTLVPGVNIQGGVVTLPSFDFDARSATAAVPLGPRKSPAVVVIATSRAGGGLNAYGALHGSRVYTTYIDTPIGTAVLQYSDPTSRPGFESELVSPEPLRIELPSGLKPVHVIVKFLMDKAGNLRELKLLECEDPTSAAVLITALRGWQFRPALKADAAIDVEAILGFSSNLQ